MTVGEPLTSWPDRIESLLERIGGPLETVRVVAECDSTQELARAMGHGALVVAGRQVAGRGQRGNTWLDTGSDGLAFSFTLAATTRPERSLALAESLRHSLGRLLEVEWSVKPPNDLLIGGRKVAGVLVEQADGLAVIGIGINVSQRDWPGALADTAISLAQAGLQISRLDVLERVLPGLVAAWEGDPDA